MTTWGDMLPESNRYSSAAQQKPVPADDCSIVQQHEKAFRDQPPAETLDEYEPVTEQMLLDWLPKKRDILPAATELVASYLELGDEADSVCLLCDTPHPDDDSVVNCKACGDSFCRKGCYPRHKCEAVTDGDGNVIKIGDRLKYRDGNKKIWEVIEMPGTFARFDMVIATNKGDRLPIRPRLMKLL